VPYERHLSGCGLPTWAGLDSETGQAQQSRHPDASDTRASSALRLGARRNKLEPAHHPSPPRRVLSTVGMEVFTGAPYVGLQSRVRRGMYLAADVDGVGVCLSSQHRVHNTVWASSSHRGRTGGVNNPLGC
jgi:hypothetical protein